MFSYNTCAPKLHSPPKDPPTKFSPPHPHPHQSFSHTYKALPKIWEEHAGGGDLCCRKFAGSDPSLQKAPSRQHSKSALSISKLSSLNFVSSQQQLAVLGTMWNKQKVMLFKHYKSHVFVSIFH